MSTHREGALGSYNLLKVINKRCVFTQTCVVVFRQAGLQGREVTAPGLQDYLLGWFGRQRALWKELLHKGASDVSRLHWGLSPSASFSVHVEGH